MKGKQEAMRVKKKIEADINELEMSLDQMNKSNSEEHKQIKRYASTLMEIEGQVSEEARIRADLENQTGISERKGHALAGELDEAHMLLDAAERSRRGAEMEAQGAKAVNPTQVNLEGRGGLGQEREKSAYEEGVKRRRKVWVARR